MRCCERHAAKLRGEVDWAGDVTANGPRMADLDVGDSAADDELVQTAPDDFDLGQLRHVISV
jgi:hypothetical protein